MPLDCQKLSFSYKNWEKIKMSYQKMNGRYVMSPTAEESLGSSIQNLRKNLVSYKDYLDKISLGNLSNQGYQFGRPELRKVTSDIHFRRIGMDIC